MREPIERRGVTQRLARAMATLVYREIDVQPWDPSLADGPVLAVSNHFGGLADGVLLIDSVERMPRIVARDVIWNVPVVGRLASAIGMIPVHRRADGPRAGNDQMFAQTYEALADNHLLLIFPEGVTQDVPFMAEVRSGAARIALGARESGVVGLRILPLGVHYEDKAGFRSRALVNTGGPIDLDQWVANRPEAVVGGGDDRAAVLDLTAEIDRALRHTAPDFPDWDTLADLHQAAQVLLHDVDPSIPVGELRYADVELIAAGLNRAEEPTRTQIVGAAHEYRVAIDAARTSDRAVLAGKGRTPGSMGWLWRAGLLAVLLPLAIIGLVIAAMPMALVALVSRLRVAPAVRASLVPAVALLLFLIEWLGLFLFFGFNAGWDLAVAVLLLFPFFVGAVLVFAEQLVFLRRRWRSHRKVSAAQLPYLQGLRGRLSELAWGAL